MRAFRASPPWLPAISETCSLFNMDHQKTDKNIRKRWLSDKLCPIFENEAVYGYSS